MCLHRQWLYYTMAERVGWVLSCPPQSEGGEFVCSVSRDSAAGWLLTLTHDLHFSLDVFFRATALLDAFLSTVKVSLFPQPLPW